LGISSASEEFQKTIESIISNIPKVRNISDDIIVFGDNEEDHDKYLHQVLQRLEENGLTLNA
jgi:4-hydroxyphenylpyruvate dioxygenase-like putative hemolysin